MTSEKENQSPSSFLLKSQKVKQFSNENIDHVLTDTVMYYTFIHIYIIIAYIYKV
jgi:hypothetical protein